MYSFSIGQDEKSLIFRVKMPTPMRLRDLIRNIRAARTAAEERAVINKVAQIFFKARRPVICSFCKLF